MSRYGKKLNLHGESDFRVQSYEEGSRGTTLRRTIDQVFEILSLSRTSSLQDHNNRRDQGRAHISPPFQALPDIAGKHCRAIYSAVLAKSQQLQARHACSLHKAPSQLINSNSLCLSNNPTANQHQLLRLQYVNEALPKPSHPILSHLVLLPPPPATPRTSACTYNRRRT